MTSTHPTLKSNTAWSPNPHLPTMYDLPSEFPEELGLPDTFHDLQPELLSITLQLKDYTNNFFTGSDLNVYYDLDNPLWHKRPDWFLAVGVPCNYYGNQDMRLSYVTWQEAANPFIVVELISPGTEAEDMGETEDQPGSPPTKWTVYESILQIPYYVVFNRYTHQLFVNKLQADGAYQQQSLTDNRLWIPELDIGLGLWHGTYRQSGAHRHKRDWLRWYDANGDWLPTEAESANQRANIAEAELAALKKKLRAKGIDPDELM